MILIKAGFNFNYSEHVSVSLNAFLYPLVHSTVERNVNIPLCRHDNVYCHILYFDLKCVLITTIHLIFVSLSIIQFECFKKSIPDGHLQSAHSTNRCSFFLIFFLEHAKRHIDADIFLRNDLRWNESSQFPQEKSNSPGPTRLDS